MFSAAAGGSRATSGRPPPLLLDRKALEILSHELRTPVTIIIGAAAILERRASDAHAVADLASDIIEEADRLDRLVGNVLAMARDAAEPEDPAGPPGSSPNGEPVLVQRLLPAVAAMVRRLQPRGELRVLLEADLPAVAGDAGDVIQVLRNLVDNARRYGPPAGPIELRAFRAGTEVIVLVLDRGIGLEPGDEERVFDLFYRAPDALQRAAGGGIGLSACAALVGRMGGRIWAHDRPGGGAEFGFALPVVPGS